MSPAENVVFFMDGAHTESSMQCAARWFRQEMDKRASDGARVLLFNCGCACSVVDERQGHTPLRSISHARPRAARASQEPTCLAPWIPTGTTKKSCPSFSRWLI